MNMTTDIVGIRPSKVTEQSAVESVVSSIRNALVSGVYKPGDRLPAEPELVATLGVSRGTVREAMKVLQAYGVVKVKQGNGTFFSEETDDIATRALIMRYALLQPTEAECWEYRAMFEGQVVRDAILYATPEDVEKLRDNLKKMILMHTNPEITAKLDIEFHTLLANSTKNRLVRSTYILAINFLESTFTRNHSYTNHSEKSVRIHAKTIELIENRDSRETSIQELIEMNEEAWITNPRE